MPGLISSQNGLRCSLSQAESVARRLIVRFHRRQWDKTASQLVRINKLLETFCISIFCIVVLYFALFLYICFKKLL
jgi:hypothetical protein